MPMAASDELGAKVQYLPMGWCVVLECQPPCTCGVADALGPFDGQEAAERALARLEDGWAASPQRAILRGLEGG
jgi:hypothetical protein